MRCNGSEKGIDCATLASANSVATNVKILGERWADADEVDDNASVSYIAIRFGLPASALGRGRVKTWSNLKR